MCTVYRLRRDALPEVPTLQQVGGSRIDIGNEKKPNERTNEKKTRFVSDNR